MPDVKLTLLHDVTFNCEEQFLAAAIVERDEWVVLSEAGKVFRFKAGEETGTLLFSLEGLVELQDPKKGFDLNDSLSIYLLDEVVVVVNDYKTHGYVFRPGKTKPIVHLSRENYHAGISAFPIALFRDENGIPHLIHGVAWNKLDVMNLETLQNLTVDKTLLEGENAEVHHIKLMKKLSLTHSIDIPWQQRAFDYFYGKLLLSPDKTHFLSKGWAWGSSDACYVFEIADFISNPRVNGQFLSSWDHCGRGICWMDNSTVATLYSPWLESDEGSTEQTPFEILKYVRSEQSWEQSEKILLTEYNRHLDGELVYDSARDVFIAFTLHKEGLTVINASGQTIFSDPSLKVHTYDPTRVLFTVLDGKTITAYALDTI